MKIRMLVSYDGTDFCGWQKQNHGPLKSVGHTLQDALETLFQQKIALYASGRTDAGVHALGQNCHFDVNRDEKSFQNWDLAWALKSQLPPSISVRKVWAAPKEFHSTLSSTRKTYRYYIYNHPRRSPFLHRYADWIRHPLDVEHLNACAQHIVGAHDFKSFQSVGTPVPHTRRNIYKARWEWKNPHVLQFTVTGSGFLKQMVRNLVGTMTMLERRDQDPSEMKRILMAHDRRLAGPPAPPQGLFLLKVYYPAELDKKCRQL